ncbi:MAG TPA: YiiD C-terminal domain-containing protein [Candidatus Competibacteraceae bacterium]|nr:YiiD C-terminal domain-containing protein [Candidatus Competibacteraceae bacterium]
MSQPQVIQEINDYLNRHVPLFQAMQARLDHCNDTGLSIVAPLEPNINDKGIAFGGSMAALAALTGWALTRITLNEHSETSEIVITDSTQKFLRPVHNEIITECLRPDSQVIERFIQSYRQRGKARWSVDVVIRADDGEPAMIFTGQYGIFRSPIPTTAI